MFTNITNHIFLCCTKIICIYYDIFTQLHRYDNNIRAYLYISFIFSISGSIRYFPDKKKKTRTNMSNVQNLIAKKKNMKYFKPPEF